MAKNDRVLVDAILHDRAKASYPSTDKGEVFELFAFEQVLKHHDLTRDELDAGWVDGSDDAGIDGFYIFVNGKLVQDPQTFQWPRRNADIEVHLLTCKHHDTFQQAPLNVILSNVAEFFDLGRDPATFKGTYSLDLLEARAALFDVVRQLSAARATLTFRVAYLSRGDASTVAPNVRTKADQLRSAIHELFSDCKVEVSFLGSAELLALYRQTRTFALPLPILEYLTGGPASYVALVRLDEFAQFVTDADGSLRRYLFDSNVRDYLGATGVNQAISSSLEDPSAPNFWWLNNGITILATHAAVVGKVIQLQDVQIVNGLQTTESVFRATVENRVERPDRAVLVKIIVSSDESVRDSIIRATNNQSLVETAALRATDKIQRDIEQALEQHDWYYERRKNYYRNVGKPLARFVTPLYLAAGCVALIMKNPAEAAQLRSRFMRSDQSYRRVFNPDLPIGVWVTITEVLKKAEAGLETVRPQHSLEGERFLANWRYLVGFLLVARHLGRFTFGTDDLERLVVGDSSEGDVQTIWALIQRLRQPKQRAYRSYPFVLKCASALAAEHGVTDIEALRPRKVRGSGSMTYPGSIISDELLEAVDAVLPEQPWKPGVHRTVGKDIGKDSNDVYAAIQRLIELGRRFHQKDGVVIDADGKIIAVDPTRQKSGSDL